MVYRVVTTCNAAGWEQLGRRCVSTFRELWPTNVPLQLYAEGFEPDVRGVETRAFPAWFEPWKLSHANDPDAHGMARGEYDFRRDCVRFAHKVAAITDAAATLRDGWLIWLDADIVTHEPVTCDWLGQFAPRGGQWISWLDRARLYPECGFMIFQCAHPAHREMVLRWRELYQSGSVFHMSETHDSFVTQQLVNKAVAEGLMAPPLSLSGAGRAHHHVFLHSPLAACMDHAKGRRKDAGRTAKGEAPVNRRERHWRA